MKQAMIFTAEELKKVKENMLKELINSTRNKYYLFNEILTQNLLLMARI